MLANLLYLPTILYREENDLERGKEGATVVCQLEISNYYDTDGGRTQRVLNPFVLWDAPGVSNY
jgi:hypothetical protein